jgi:hypothetical protein
MKLSWWVTHIYNFRGWHNELLTVHIQYRYWAVSKIIQPSKVPTKIYIVTYSGFLFTMELYCTPKVNILQLHTASNSWNTRTRPTCTVSEHSLQFLQSESFQTQVGTIHRRAIGTLAHHNGTSAYSPSLTCHLPAPTIECLHRPPYKLTCSSYNFPIRTQSSNQKESVAKYTTALEWIPTHTGLKINPTLKTTKLVTIETPVHCCESNNAACPHC